MIISNDNYFYDEKSKAFEINDNAYHIMMVLTNADGNNNKFYELKLEDGQYCALYGRVGSKGTKVSLRDFKEFKKKAFEKFKKGYRPVNIKTISEETIKENKSNLENIAKQELIDFSEKEEDKKTLEKLIHYLVKTNKHNIEKISGGLISIDDDGLVKTAVGIVSIESINNAKEILEKIYVMLKKKDFEIHSLTTKQFEDFKNKLNQYLMLVPQKVKAKDWHLYFIKSEEDAQKQFEFLNSLSNSIELYEKLKEERLKEIKNKKENKEEKREKIFHHKLKILNDKKVFQEIEKYFEETKKQNHSSYHFKLKQVYEILNEEDKINSFNQLVKEKGNVNLYWHGTQNYNILSILKSGLVIPKSNAFNVTGRMFGDGVYFSKDSTKSLNYSSGYWIGERNDKIYLFLADVIMGKVFEAAHKNAGNYSKYKMYPVEGFDSVIARGGQQNYLHDGGRSSLINPEMIVYDLNQIFLKYLCEFEI